MLDTKAGLSVYRGQPCCALLSAQLDSYEKEYRARFDDVIVPALEDVPYQYRIVRANEYMVDRADTIVAYVNTPIGGAAKTLAYAERKKKRIIRIE